MGLIDLIAGIFKPAADLIDNLHTSEEEKLTIRQAMFEAQMAAAAKAQEYESQLLKSKADIITAEAQGGSWIQRNWRPITMLTFLFLVVCDSFGWLVTPLAAEAWTLLQIGLGGYVVGRSVEKVAPKIKDMTGRG
jgi:hypothetical protein